MHEFKAVSFKNIKRFYLVCMSQVYSIPVNKDLGIFMFAPRVNRIKLLFIFPTDAQYYKIVEMLKHLKL
jgi:hypothetical protein